jgi:hypothetical protein
MIVDRPEDEACAAAAGIKFIWASVMHPKFADPGMREIECQHIQPEILTDFRLCKNAPSVKTHPVALL